MAGAAEAPRLHHLGYVVDDLERAAHDFARAYGIGPFVAPPHAELRLGREDGAGCTWEHEVALAAWGGVRVEIQTVGAVAPPALERELGGGPTRLSHLGFRVADLDAEVERLAQEGTVPFLRAEGGPLRFGLFADPLGAAYVELQQDHPALRHMDAVIAQAAQGWDGREPLRSLHQETEREERQ